MSFSELKLTLLLLQCTDKLERDRLILFLNKLILNKVGLSLSDTFCIYCYSLSLTSFSPLLFLNSREM